jgi:hypothetical protein
VEDEINRGMELLATVNVSDVLFEFTSDLSKLV